MAWKGIPRARQLPDSFGSQDSGRSQFEYRNLSNSGFCKKIIDLDAVALRGQYYGAPTCVLWESKGRGGIASCVQNEAAGSDYVHGLAPALSVYLFENPVNVVPHRKFRQVEARSDFLICQTLGNQRN